MTASASQPSVHQERRIIERPRLIKLLDDTDARTILLLAPAGYGKTTLARQWAKTLNGAVWVTLTGAHADVAWLAGDIAHAADGTDGTTVRTIRQHIRARLNPQRACHELGARAGYRIQHRGRPMGRIGRLPRDRRICRCRRADRRPRVRDRSALSDCDTHTPFLGIGSALGLWRNI